MKTREIVVCGISMEKKDGTSAKCQSIKSIGQYTSKNRLRNDLATPWKSSHGNATFSLSPQKNFKHAFLELKDELKPRPQSIHLQHQVLIISNTSSN